MGLLKRLAERLREKLAGKKTYLGAAGLFALAAYNFTQGDFATAWHNLDLALVAVGIRAAVAKTEEAVAA